MKRGKIIQETKVNAGQIFKLEKDGIVVKIDWDMVSRIFNAIRNDIEKTFLEENGDTEKYFYHYKFTTLLEYDSSYK